MQSSFAVMVFRFIALTIILSSSAAFSSPVPLTWSFDQTNFIVPADGIIPLYTTLTNSSNETLRLKLYSYGWGYTGADPLEPYTFQGVFSPSLFDLLGDVTLAPGDVTHFLLGTLVPKNGAYVPPGTYSGPRYQLQFNVYPLGSSADITVPSANTFTISVVPIPASLPLLASTLLLLFGMMRYTQRDRRFSQLAC